MNETDSASTIFPIVAIGANADGIEPLTEIVYQLPSNMGLTYIYLQHCSTENLKELAAGLQSATRIPISVAEEEMILEPDHLYLVPETKFFDFVDGRFVEAKQSAQVATLPINLLFSAVAEAYQEMAIGVLISGNDSDGILGLKAIKTVGGISILYDKTGGAKGLAKSTIDGNVDLTLSPSEIVTELVQISKKKDLFYKVIKELSEDAIDSNDEELIKILQLLQKSTGVDFTQYKMSTIKRRIIRRMMLFKIEYLKNYAEYLRQNVNEINFLYQDLLINVTNFFVMKKPVITCVIPCSQNW